MKAVLSSFVAAIVASCAPAYAQTTPLCMPEEELVTMITQDYEEILGFQGLTTLPNGENILAQMWVNQTEGTWTYTGLLGSGLMCVVDTGLHGFLPNTPLLPRPPNL